MPAKEVAKQEFTAHWTPTLVENPILDSLHIYDVESVAHRQLPLNAARDDMMLNSVRGNVIRARTTLIAAAILVAGALLSAAFADDSAARAGDGR